MTGIGSLERLRRANRRTLIALISSEGPVSRADLVRASGLSSTTVSSLVAELVAAGRVVEAPGRGVPHKGGSGRPPTLLALAAPTGAVAGLDIGHAHLRVAVAGRAGEVLAEAVEEADADRSGTTALDRAARLVVEVTRAAGMELSDLRALGMCVPAPIERRTGVVSTGILPGWQGLDPAAEMQRRLAVPVTAGNDADVGALAEHRLGAARGVQDAVYLKVASGLGAGLVLGGRVHRGAAGMAGEVGHVQIREDGLVCRCGNRGCLETLVAAPRLIAALQPAHDEPLSVPRILELAAAGDAGVRRVLGDAGATIGRALADLCNWLNPGVLVVGGPLGGAEALLAGIRGSVDRYSQPATAASVRVVPAELGERAEVVGAVALAVASAPVDD